MSTVPQIVAERIAWATRYVEVGWKVFVLGIDKTPLPNCSLCRAEDWKHDRERCSCLTCHGFYAATDSIDRYAEMIERYPDGWLAVRTGSASRLLVLDFEAAPNEQGVTGLDTLDQWEMWTGMDLPPTLKQRTQSGGLHLLYSLAPGVTVKSRNRILPQCDVKGEGGYVAVPTPGRPERAWIPERYGAAPSELLAALDKLRGRSGGGGGSGGAASVDGYDYHAYLRDGCPGGARDQFFNELLFRLRKDGRSREDAHVIASHQWTRCAQPNDERPGMNAEWFMPWEHVEYKLHRMWQTVAPPEPMPAWRPTNNVVGTTERGETIVGQGNVAVVRGDW